MKHYRMRPSFISQGLNDRQQEPLPETYEKICGGCQQPFRPSRSWYAYCPTCNKAGFKSPTIEWRDAA